MCICFPGHSSSKFISSNNIITPSKIILNIKHLPCNLKWLENTGKQPAPFSKYNGINIFQLCIYNCAYKEGFQKSSHILYAHMNRQPNNIHTIVQELFVRDM